MVAGESTTAPKERILHAAVEILGRDGAVGLTMRRVAEVSDGSTMGVYTHFGGKVGLLEAIYLDAFERFDAAVARVDAIVDGRERLRAGASEYRDWALANPTHYLVMFSSLVPGFTPGQAALERAGASGVAHLARVRYAMATGALRHGDAAAVAHHVWASVHGHVMLDLLLAVPADDVAARERFELAVEWLLRGLG